MRETSAAEREPSPASLMVRLALLERGLRLVPRSRVGAVAGPPAAGSSRRQVIGASFAIGLACGALLGTAALSLLSPARARHASAPAGLEAQSAAPAMLPASALDMPLSESGDGKAPFPLHVAGADGADGLRVTLRDLPEPVWLSRGERLDEHTWQLTLADLEGLQVTLGAGTPETFAVTIDVTSAEGTPAARTIAHVRLAARSETAQRPPLPPSTAATIEDLLRRPVAPPQVRSAPATPAEIKSATRVEERIAAPATRSPPPEGISTLGGPTLEDPAASRPASEERRVWWRLPTPTPGWAPFADRASGN